MIGSAAGGKTSRADDFRTARLRVNVVLNQRHRGSTDVSEATGSCFVNNYRFRSQHFDVRIETGILFDAKVDANDDRAVRYSG